jgi:phosphonate transport system ATP-binding protein
MEVVVESLSKHYRTPRNGRVRALDGVSLRVEPGERVALLGPSGSGKTTLLRSIAGLECGERGRVRVGDSVVQDAGRLAPRARRVRAEIGLVAQQFNLVSRLDVLTNVLAGQIARVPRWRAVLRRFSDTEREEGIRALARVGLAETVAQRAGTLSGGQQQRVAIARTLVQRARVILGDEPVASLDPRNARSVLERLSELSREDGVTVLLSLHHVDLARLCCARVVGLAGGRIVFDGRAEDLGAAEVRLIYGGDVPASTPTPVGAEAA